MSPKKKQSKKYTFDEKDYIVEINEDRDWKLNAEYEQFLGEYKDFLPFGQQPNMEYLIDQVFLSNLLLFQILRELRGTYNGKKKHKKHKKN